MNAVKLLRPLIALLVIAAACWGNYAFTEHHAPNEKFEVVDMFGHLKPAAILTGSAVESHEVPGEETHAAHAARAPLFSIPLPTKTFCMLESTVEGDHVHEGGDRLVLTNMQVFQLLAVVLIFVLMGGVARYVRTGRGDIVSRTFAGFCMFVRDDMVYPVMGRESGRKFLPYFLSLFFFITFMNVMGLMPFSATPTASIAVTFGMAFTTLLVMMIGGMVVQGPINYFKHLVPEVPWWLWPLMFVVELIGVIAKPFALMVRLFANTSGGHMVVLSFIGLIFLARQDAGAEIAWSAAPFAVGFGVFIMIIEGFVALLQAYVFTYLSILFIGGSLHPDH